MKLLIADDSSIVRNRLAELASKLPDVEVAAQATDALSALEAIHRHRPDIAILDIRMPAGGGMEVLRQLHNAYRPHAVIMLTNYPEPQYRKRCMDLGADFFFDKSREFHKVAHVLKTLAEEPNLGETVRQVAISQLVELSERNISSEKRRVQAEEALRRRDAILQAVSRTANQFLMTPSWKKSALHVLEELGKATAVAQNHLVENQRTANGALYPRTICSWAAENAAPHAHSAFAQEPPWEQHPLACWVNELKQGRVLATPVERLPAEAQESFRRRNIASVVAVPISSANEWWGYLRFESHRDEPPFSRLEIEALKGAASTIGAAVHRAKVDEVLRQRLAFEQLVSELSGAFATIEDIDFNQVLKLMGEAIQVDRAYIFKLREGGQVADNTHEWCAPGVRAQIGELQEVREGDLPWIFEQVRAGNPVSIPTADALPPEAAAEKAFLESTGVAAALVVPVRCPNGTLYGCIGFDSVASAREWSPDEMGILRVAANMLGSYIGRKKSEQQLKESEIQLRLALAAGRMGVWDRDLLADKERWSKEMDALFEIEPGTFDGSVESFLAFVHPEDVDRLRSNIDRQMNDSERAMQFAHEYRIRTAKGNERWIMSRGQIVRDPKGQRVRSIGVAMDISHIMQTERELRRANAFLDSVIENIPAMVFIKDARDLSYVRVNRVGEEMMGFSRATLEGQTAERLFPEDEARRFRETDREALASGKPIEFHDHVLSSGTGEKRYLQAKKVPVLDEQGRPQYLVGIAMDVTERKKQEEALRRSEANYHAIFDAASDAIITCDIETGRIVDVNDRMCELFGYSREEAGRLHLHDLCDDRPSLTEANERRKLTELEPQETRVFEWCCKDQSGRHFWVEVNIRAAHIGTTERLLAVIRDIEPRKQLDEERRKRAALALSYRDALLALAESHAPSLEARLRQITETGASTLNVQRVSVWLCNDDHRSAVCRDLFLREPGRHERPAPLNVQRYRNYFGYLEKDRTLTVEDALRDPRTHDLVETYLAPEGVTSKMDAVIRRGGQIVGMICHEHTGPPREWTLEEQNFAASLANMVSAALEEEERRLAEAEQRRLNAAIAQAAEAVVITDRYGRIEYVNPSFERVTGYTRDEALGETPRILKSGKQDDAFYRQMWETILSGHIWDGHLVNRRKDGSTYEEHMTITPVYGDDGEIVHFIAVKQDVTEKKNLEEQLAQSQKLEAVGRLAGGVAHDFNNLLTAIIGFSRMILDDLKPAHPLRPDMEEILGAGERAAHLTRQLLAFSRKEIVQVTPVDLRETVKQLARLLERTLGEDVRLELQVDEKGGLVMADPGHLEQVILNLAINARDAMPKGGTLTIGTERAVVDAAQCKDRLNLFPGPYVVLRVRDTGHGMTEEVRKRIFEPFFTTKEEGRGTGLGLSTVYGIVQSCKGHIDVDSAPGEGAEFRLYFPEHSAALAQAAEETQGAAGSHGETILLVEDEAAVRRVTARMLSNRGYRVKVAASAAEGEKIVRAHQGALNLIISDVVLPGKSGPEFIREVRQLRTDFQVLFISGFPAARLAQEDLSAWDAQFLHKPFKETELIQAIQKLLNAHDGGESAA